MSKLTEILSSLFKGDKIVEKVGDILDDAITTKEEKIKSLTDYYVQTAEQEIKEQEIVVMDRKDARWKEVELAKLGRTDFLQLATGITILAAFNLSVYAIIFKEIPEANREVFMHLLGIIEGAFISGMVAYYFGTSKASREKDKTIRDIAGKK